PAFRKPEWRNARQTLVVMGTGLGVMFLGLSFLASKVRIAPYEDGTPTVLAQIGEAVHGDGPVGAVLSDVLNLATMLILVLAANTGFADFPRLASLQAGDSFLPRQLTKRGHRLVFSNGILTRLRHRGVHRLHAVAGRHDPPPPAPARPGLGAGRGRQRRRRRAVG